MVGRVSILTRFAHRARDASSFSAAQLMTGSPVTGLHVTMGA